VELRSLGRAERLIRNRPSTLVAWQRVIDDLDETIHEVRSVILSLHATFATGPASGRGFLEIADDEREALGFEPRVRFLGPVDAMDVRIATELIPTVLEALSNVAKHARAASVEMVVESGDEVTLRVVDEGRGIGHDTLGRRRHPQHE
jgi:signal transduction histidine kinase